jgi:hypothetical protein
MPEIENTTGSHRSIIEILDENFESMRVEVRDPILTGRQIAELGQRRPPDEYVILARGKEGGLREIAEDETVDVNETTIFWAIASDRSFRFSIDEIQYDWPIAIVPAETLYRLGQIDAQTHVLIWVRPESQNKELRAGEKLDLAERGVEHLVSREHKNQKTIYVDDRPYQVEPDHLSGIQIKNLAGIEANYQLFMERSGDDQAIADDFSVKIVDGSRFYSLPPATFG